MKTVIMAEKPDQGLTLASPFKHKRHDGYVEIFPNEIFPNGAYCTWAIGHLTELCPPEHYQKEWKKWSIDHLPMVPEKFQYTVTKSKYKQFNIVKRLLQMKEVTSIIHAGDAGREGELIVRNVINLTGVRKPMKRLWISSLTKKAIYEGFQQLLDEEETRNTYYEAYTRACADWIIGMNASRVYTLLLKKAEVNDVFSVGRVQTPTLALIVQREKEIENFKSKPFWEVIATFQMNGDTYEGTWEKKNESRLDNAEMANKIAAFCQNKEAQISELKTNRKVYKPPLLFNLSSLQATANSAFKFSPKKTLDVLQQLYQKGIVSYPRSNSSHVTKGEAETFPDILDKLSQFDDYRDFIPVPNPSIMNNKRFVDEKKVTDHYAIIPTEQVTDPARLSGDERKLYDMIVRRLIAAHYDDAVFDYTTVTTLVDGRATFISKGKQQIEEGWRKIIFQDKKDEDTLLPPLKKDDQGKVQKVRVKEGKTEPPKRYTEGQLITLMKTAGKFIEDEELEKVLQKVEGLGTEATRAGIITMLKDRQYINVTKNQVFATDKGKVIIAAIGETILASPEMTAKWEQRLSEIGDGKTSPAGFMEQTKKLSAKIIEDAKNQVSDWDFSGIQLDSIQRAPSKFTIGKKVGTCILCDGDVVDKGQFYGCSNYKKSKCSFTLSKKILGKNITQTNVKKLLTGEETNMIKGFKKGEKSFDAKLRYEKDKIQFVFK